VNDTPRKRQKAVAFIDPDNCTGCGVCLEFRPTDPKNRPQLLPCIFVAEGTNAQHSGICVVDQPVCVGCTICVQYCPWEAITMVSSDGVLQPTLQGVGYLRDVLG
jgi:Pyruvate/2-oxoacid:ferredoxin oxidoreductase delta subunit